MNARLFLLFITLLLTIGNASPIQAQSIDSDDDDSINELSMKPKFSRPSSGGGIALGFDLTGVTPASLDPDLAGDLVLTNVDAYLIVKGLLFGGSWTSATLYDPGKLYDEFSFGYKGFLLGYDHSLFYGKMTIRPNVLLGSGNITMIKKRPDLTFDTIANPSGREVLERVRDQNFFMFRPGIGIGYSPMDLLQFRAEVGFMLPSGDGNMDDLRKPIYSFQIVFGGNR